MTTYKAIGAASSGLLPHADKSVILVIKPLGKSYGLVADVTERQVVLSWWCKRHALAEGGVAGE